MPYSLQAYSLPEWFVEPPREWEQRLREISPVTDQLSHLRFRFFDAHPTWNFPERGMWTLYACTPRHLVPKERAQMYAQHWSEVPLEPEKPVPDAAQKARKASVSSYQHYLWHVHGVEAKPFWILQGPNGGTAAAYSYRERKLLEGDGWASDPFPLGFLPACLFDERAVSAVVERDRFVRAGKDLDVLVRQDRPEAMRSEESDAEKAFRRKFLSNWVERIQPQKEFLASYLRKTDADMTLPPGTREMADNASKWRDIFLETGEVVGARIASSQQVARAVDGATPSLILPH